MGNGVMHSLGLKEKDETLTEKCRIWSGICHEDFRYPELHDKDCSEITKKPLNFGIALSGGGLRAATLAIGTLRGLNILGVFSQARYISSNSGSSWVNGPLSYYQGDVKEFLGEYLPPEECTLSNLRKVDINSHSFAICGGGNIKTIIDELRNNGPMDMNDNDPRAFWSQAIGRIFFHDYGLNNFNCLPAMPIFFEKFKSLHSFQFSPYDHRRSPFPIINGSALVYGDRVFAPIEFTPMYYSFPASVEYHQAKKRAVVGGYLIEPLGFTSRPSKSLSRHVKSLLNIEKKPLLLKQSPPIPVTSLPPRHIHVDVTIPKHVISIADQTGISSSFHTQGLGHIISTQGGKSLDCSVYPIWNPLNGECHEMILADGAGADNTAIIALLRRRVSKIFAMYAIDQSIMTPVDHRNMSQSTFSDVAGLFGVMTCDGETTIDGIKPEEFNKSHQVFPSEDYSHLVGGLRSRYLEGQPCSYLLRTRALPNALIAVPGGHDVEILFVLCAPSDKWVNKLPEMVKLKVLEQRKEIDKIIKKRTQRLSNNKEQDESESEHGKKEKEKDHEKDMHLNEVGSFSLPSDRQDEREGREGVGGEGDGDGGAEEGDGEDNQIYSMKGVRSDDNEEDENGLLSYIEEILLQLTNKIKKLQLSILPDISQFREKLNRILQPSTLQQFPYTPIESVDYTSQLTNLLTNLMTWEVIESQDLLAELLECDVTQLGSLMSQHTSQTQRPRDWIVEDFL